MITIGKPYITTEKEHCYLNARVFVSDDTARSWIEYSKEHYQLHWRTYTDYPPKNWKDNNYTMWFRAPKEYARFLTDEVCDAFLVAMIYYAMASGSDIRCEAPVSEKLFYGITTHIIPLLCNEKHGYRRIRVEAKTTDRCFNAEKKVGTGMSCGVDSLYTLWKYTLADTPENYRLDTLTYLNMGAIFHPDMKSSTQYTLEEFYKKTDEMSEEKLQCAVEVGNAANMPVIYIESNMDSDFYRGCYGYTCVYRNTSCILAMSKYFSKYYCSSAGWPNFYDPTLHDGSEHYELMLCPFLSSDSVEFILSDEATRLEKTTALADDKIAQKYLDVCFRFNNCGVCSKCFRTLITLDLIGKLENFKDCFDIEKFRRSRVSAYYWLLKTKGRKPLTDDAVFAIDLYELAKKKKMIPFLSRFKYFFTRPLLAAEQFISLKLLPKSLYKWLLLKKYHLISAK